MGAVTSHPTITGIAASAAKPNDAQHFRRLGFGYSGAAAAAFGYSLRSAINGSYVKAALSAAGGIAASASAVESFGKVPPGLDSDLTFIGR